MNRKSDGKEFEETVHDLYALLSENEAYQSVQKNVMLPGADGLRQIDVLIKATIANFDVLTIVECRDHSRPLDITAIDGLHSKMQDVKAHKAVLVSRAGFSKAARNKAERIGISLFTAESVGSGVKNIGLQLPVVFQEIECTHLAPEFSVYIENAADFDLKGVYELGDDPLEQRVIDAIRNSQIHIPLRTKKIAWNPDKKLKWHLRDTAGRIHETDNVKVHIDLTVKWYAGHLEDLPSSMCLAPSNSGLISYFVNAEELRSYRDFLVPFKSFDSIPDTQERACLLGITAAIQRPIAATCCMTHVDTRETYNFNLK
jgi:Restriction endonuclease